MASAFPDMQVSQLALNIRLGCLFYLAISIRVDNGIFRAHIILHVERWSSFFWSALNLTQSNLLLATVVNQLSQIKLGQKFDCKQWHEFESVLINIILTNHMAKKMIKAWQISGSYIGFSRNGNAIKLTWLSMINVHLKIKLWS